MQAVYLFSWISRRFLMAAGCLWGLAAASVTQAFDLQVAVASNFRPAAQALVQQFSADTGYEVGLSSASSGKLATQILHGAPFDVFLSADQKMPMLLVDKGKAEASSLYTYAIGRLVLWQAASSITDADNTGSVRSNEPATVQSMNDQQLAEHLKQLLAASKRPLALANPRLAPYGLAAQQVLEHLQLTALTKSRLVTAENVAQTFQFIDSGNASAGFVARSLVMPVAGQEAPKGQGWLVPDNLYSPIRQDAVLVPQQGHVKPAARKFWHFLRSEKGRAVIRQFGYRVVKE